MDVRLLHLNKPVSQSVSHAGADADRHLCGDQNVMCMRSGLVIKTAPVVRTVSLSSRCPTECSETRPPSAAGPRPEHLAQACAVRSLQPASPALSAG